MYKLQSKDTRKSENISNDYSEKQRQKEIIEQVILIQRAWRRFLAQRKIQDQIVAMQMGSYLSTHDTLQEAFDVLVRNYVKHAIFGFLRERKAKILRICRYIKRYRFVQTIRRSIFKKRLGKVQKRLYEVEAHMKRSLDQQVVGPASPTDPTALFANFVKVLPDMGAYSRRTTRVALRSALFSLHLAKEQDVDWPSKWIASFAQCLNSCFVEDDSLLDLRIQKDVTLALSAKQMLYMFSNGKSLLTRVQLPWKVFGCFQSVDRLYLLTESAELVVVDSPLRRGHSKPSQIDSGDLRFVAQKEFPRVKCLAVRDLFLVVSTETGQVCVKDNLIDASSPFDVWQVKRQVVRVEVGGGFFGALDRDGVLFTGGRNHRGQLGLGHCRQVAGMHQVHFESGRAPRVVSFACGKAHMLASTSRNRVFAWGCNLNCQISSRRTRSGKVHTGCFAHPEPIFETVVSKWKCSSAFQVGAGKSSSFLASALNRVVFMGKSSEFMEGRPERQWDLCQLFGKHFLVVSLRVEWNTKIEVVYFKFIDASHARFKSKSRARTIQKQLFAKMGSSKKSLLEYSDLVAREIDIHFLSSKASQFDLQNQKLPKSHVWKKMYVTKQNK